MFTAQTPTPPRPQGLDRLRPRRARGRGSGQERGGGATADQALQPRTPPDMSRSFYVDSLIIKDSSRPAPSLPEPHPGPDFFIPLGMPSPLVMSVSGPGCQSRKSGAFCACPLGVTPHPPAPRGPAGSGGGGAGTGSAGTGGGGAAGAAGALPLLKSQFSSSPGDAQFCPRVSHAHHHHHPPQHHHHHHQPQQPGSAAAAAAAAVGSHGHGAACTCDLPRGLRPAPPSEVAGPAGSGRGAGIGAVGARGRKGAWERAG